ncbi:MAG: peptidylprolyl isomerase [Alphaproteobacteria bacterium]|nr:peptidylprolyl isomerase [Alphaproteobacteria bacterium]MDE1987594.1 peptidylprolyl isomerase [Alphaproteobacteria bacterium]MDE2162834.1 peptidylprolyl isomerase [Alphaproteobacteria bacterium]MDE2265208.1 peptidylprolyl isomerase [Alphaproteobacteria bacterium]MDE2499237.1 peptidylprolyl isomerase [Alphaproteobacteria bacterium]
MAAGPQRDALATPAPATTAPANGPVQDQDAQPDDQTTSGMTQQASLAPPPDTTHYQDDIVALVNDKPISAYDLHQRVALVMTTSNLPDNPEIKKKIRQQVLEQLETEMLQRQEALKNDITVSSVEVDKDIQDILTSNHMTMDQLKEVLARGRVNIATLRAQIAAQLLWQKAVSQEYAGRVHITPDQVDAELARIAEGQHKVHYVVSEIFLPVDTPEQDAKVLKDAQNLESQMQAGAPFQSIARQFSQSPSAAEGGDIGLVYEGQLAPELTNQLEKMKPGEMSPPIRSIGGYYILLLRQRLEPVGTKIPDAQAQQPATAPTSLPLARILLPLGPNPPKPLVENALKIAMAMRSHITTCDVAKKMTQEVKGSVYFSLGDMKLADLSAQIRDAVLKTEPGGTADPFQSAAGIEIFVRCDKAIPKIEAFQMPTRDQVEQQLFEEQISALARRYNRDIKRNADIELR